MGLITLKEIDEAYKATGLKPVSRVFLGKKCACPLSVLVIRKFGRRKMVGILRSAENGSQCRTIGLLVGLNIAQTTNFINGFDGIPVAAVCQWGQYHHAAYTKGVAARRRFIRP